jgi:hypothetical protein
MLFLRFGTYGASVLVDNCSLAVGGAVVGEPEALAEAFALAFAAIAAMAGGTLTSLIVCALPRRWIIDGDPSPTLLALFKKRFPVLTPLDGLKRAANEIRKSVT